MENKISLVWPLGTVDYRSSTHKKKLSSIPLAHRIRLSAHAICIILGTEHITSSREDFQVSLSTTANTFNLRTLCERRTRARCGTAIAHLPQAQRRSGVQEEHRYCPSQILDCTSSLCCLPLKTYGLSTFTTYFGMKFQVYIPIAQRAC